LATNQFSFCVFIVRSKYSSVGFHASLLTFLFLQLIVKEAVSRISVILVVESRKLYCCVHIHNLHSLDNFSTTHNISSIHFSILTIVVQPTLNVFTIASLDLGFHPLDHSLSHQLAHHAPHQFHHATAHPLPHQPDLFPFEFDDHHLFFHEVKVELKESVPSLQA
jgi:hypothetical protein